MNALQEIMWTKIIDPLWRKRNNTKHEKTGVHDEREAETLNDRIKWHVEHQHEVLSHGDLFLAKIDVGTTNNEDGNEVAMATTPGHSPGNL